jgi:hypothetical protein
MTTRSIISKLDSSLTPVVADLENSYTIHLGGIDHPQIEWRLFSVTNGVIFIASVVWSPPVSEPLHATFGLKIAPVVAENKHCSIFALL